MLKVINLRPVRIISLPSYSIIHNCPWISKTGVTKTLSEADKKFFNGISQRDNCSLHLLPPPCDTHNEIVVRKHVSHTIHKNKTVLFIYQFCPCKLCRLIVLLYIEFHRIMYFCMMYMFVGSLAVLLYYF